MLAHDVPLSLSVHVKFIVLLLAMLHLCLKWVWI